MSIVCGTDFSESAQCAAEAAAELAVRMNVALHFVHSVELNSDTLFEEVRSQSMRWAKHQLESVAERARGRGARVEVHLVEGAPDESLQDVAQRVSAQLIVVAALVHRRAGMWQLGSHAERLAQHSHVPVLVVRNAALFQAWVRELRPLRILLGMDLTLSSDRALRWIAALRKFGPCEVIATYLYWPPTQFQRLGLAGVRSYLDPDPDVTNTLIRDISKRAHDVLGSAPSKLRVEPHLGSLGERLAAVAEEERADLIVVGSHDRALAERLLHGSVSRDVVHHARASTVCVPADETDTATGLKPQLESVLVATDFSTFGNAAIPLAYSVLGAFGTLHLVHVAKTESIENPSAPHDIFCGPATQLSEAEAAARHQLRDLIAAHGGDPTRTSELHLLRSHDPAAAICQAAERLDVGLLCLGTHGRSGLSKLLLGSVASAVLGASVRPVLLARGPRT
jgi:nucleotide-binding universal stress UspA family protein